MNMHVINKKMSVGGLFLIGGLGFIALMPMTASAATCSFNRDLYVGVVGDDVRCLQQYLNSAGFVISTSGAGSAGSETDEFKTLTESALIKWQQAKGITPASGTFGRLGLSFVAPC